MADSIFPKDTSSPHLKTERKCKYKHFKFLHFLGGPGETDRGQSRAVPRLAHFPSGAPQHPAAV